MTATLDEHLSQVCLLLQSRAGLLLESLGAQSIARAVEKRAIAVDRDTVPDYLRLLLIDAAEFQELLEELVVQESWFFRDASAFRCLAGYLDRWRAAAEGSMRVLSVGCSAGEEVYSLAMALNDAGIEAPRIEILGVDLSQRSLEMARQGVFFSRSFRNLDEQGQRLREQWFQPAGDTWQVRESLRSGIEFRWANLAQNDFLAGEAPFDVVFCRNVLIYFHGEARHVALRHMRRLLKPSGLLCSSPAEARIFSEHGFRSLGSDCPFAFRHPDSPADPAIVEPRQTKPVTVQGPRTVPSARGGQSHFRGLGHRRQKAEAASSPPTVPGVTTETTTGQAILNAARLAADAGRLVEADALCGQALSGDPTSAEAHFLRGVIRHSQGMFPEAQRSLEKALYLDPGHYGALVHMMLLMQHRGDQTAAANYRRRAQQAAPRGGD
ncbi:MAG: CheR family methyltransferase [Planctomycetota bacterium]